MLYKHIVILDVDRQSFHDIVSLAKYYAKKFIGGFPTYNTQDLLL